MMSGIADKLAVAGKLFVDEYMFPFILANRGHDYGNLIPMNKAYIYFKETQTIQFLIKYFIKNYQQV
jgi:hypothetical protein